MVNYTNLYSPNAYVTLDETEYKLVQQVAYPRKLKTGHTVFREEDAANYIYFIEKGHIKIYRDTLWGKTVTVGIRQAGDLIGVCEVLNGMSRRGYAETLEPSVLWAIDGQAFRKILQERPGIAVKVATALANRLRQVETMVADMVSMEVDRRLARALVNLARQQDASAGDGTIRLSLPLTQQDLAALVGSCRQTVTTTMQKLKDLGFIETNKKYIDILNIKGLQDFIDR